MRTSTLIAILLWSLSATVIHAEDPAGPQLSAYQARVSEIAFRAIIPQFRKHPEHLKGALKVTFRVDRRGHPSEITVASSTSDEWVQDTARRMIRTARFPELPAKLLAEIRQDYVFIIAGWSFTFHPNKA